MSTKIKPIANIEKNLSNYLEIVKEKYSEDAKAQMFLDFIKPIFGIELGDLDFQVPTNSTVYNVRGRIDCVFGQTIFEFKKQVSSASLEVGIKELIKYFQSHHENSKNSIVGVITDGIKFKVYHPKLEANVVVDVELINELDLEKSNVNATDIFLWFDSYFFSSDKITPTSDDIKQRFGLKSPTYNVIAKKLDKLFQKCEDVSWRPTIIKYENWVRYLEVIYGNKLENKSLFFRHTYLSTLVKLLIYVKLTKGKLISSADIGPVLFGDVFRNAGLANFIEDDFFTWITAPVIRKEASKMFFDLLTEIESYDLEEIDEDVLKELYHQLVDDEVRQLLGEFYTPDWLAEHMVRATLGPGIDKMVLDPACGSGTFLFKTISYKISNFKKSKMKEDEILEHILNEVVGFDVHPLAVMIAKTNYVLALKNLLNFKKGAITIPVYLSDTLKTPTKIMNVSTSIPTFEFEAANKKFEFPEIIAKDLVKMDEIIDIMKVHGQEFERLKEKTPGNVVEIRQNLGNSFKKAIEKEKDEIKPSLINSCNVLFDLIIEGNDSIWPFILRNMYKPISVESKKVDVLLGNPPWLGLQKMKNQHYQDYLNKQCYEYGLATNSQNMTHMDLASLFFYQTCDKYLKDGGQISFVMPRSVMQSSQHVNFRKFEKPKMKLVLFDDFDFDTKEKVEPLFKIPACSLYAIKGKETKYPIEQNVFSGKLNNSNVQLDEAMPCLTVRNTKYEPQERSFSGGHYYSLFKQGATVVPGAFWFIKPKIDVVSLGFNPSSPLITSEENPKAKPPWKNIVMEGCVEKEFLFTTIIGSDLVPFGYVKRKLLVLPITIDNRKTELVNNPDIMIGIGDEMKKWLRKAEEHWEENATAKSKNMTIYERLNYSSGLTQQNPKSKFKVLYIRSGAYMAACVVSDEDVVHFDINGVDFTVEKGLISDSTTYWFDTESEKEAYYLSAILNSEVMNNFIRIYQSKGKFGGRDIHKIPLEFSIPKYNENNTTHQKLSKLGGLCKQKIPQILNRLSYRSIGKVRGEIRKELATEYTEIDDLVKMLDQKY